MSEIFCMIYDLFEGRKKCATIALDVRFYIILVIMKREELYDLRYPQAFLKVFMIIFDPAKNTLKN